MAFTTTEPAPARWFNTGGYVTVHLVPASTKIVEPEKGDSLYGHAFQETTPLCGSSVHSGAWQAISLPPQPPLRLCPACFPEG